MIQLKHLPWDSEFFGLKVGRLLGQGTRDELLRTISDAVDANFKCLYYLAYCDDRQTVNAMASVGFNLVDVRVEMSKCLDDHAPSAREFDVSLATEGDVQDLVRHARGAFSLSRFYADPHFSRSRCDDLYSAWIAKDCARSLSHMTVVAEKEGKLAGFWSAEIVGAEARVGLVFVAPEFRGRGVPATMVSYMVEKLKGLGVKNLASSTQGSNWASVRMHANCGFKFVGTKLWYHGWL